MLTAWMCAAERGQSGRVSLSLSRFGTRKFLSTNQRVFAGLITAAGNQQLHVDQLINCVPFRLVVNWVECVFEMFAWVHAAPSSSPHTHTHTSSSSTFCPCALNMNRQVSSRISQLVFGPGRRFFSAAPTSKLTTHYTVVSRENDPRWKDVDMERVADETDVTLVGHFGLLTNQSFLGCDCWWWSRGT